MKVKLISKTENPVETMFVAARTCYSSESPSYRMEDLLKDKLQDENYHEPWILVKKVLESGHTSIAEHVNMTFTIEGISRACSHQLVRHRHCTFSQQSQRYVEIKEDVNELRKLYMMDKDKLMTVLEKYFVSVNHLTYVAYLDSLTHYLQAVEKGVKPEDARYFLANAAKTNLVMTCNLRELMHICELRLCTRAQEEIRIMCNLIVKQVEKEYGKDIASLLVPKCERLGFCTEHKCCGRKPSVKTIKEGK